MPDRVPAFPYSGSGPCMGFDMIDDHDSEHPIKDEDDARRSGIPPNTRHGCKRIVSNGSRGMRRGYEVNIPFHIEDSTESTTCTWFAPQSVQ
ncbi:hypothetical protein IAQ61_002823 [Plenodomus lingam]|uniref:uncharacterized protein n=1 Tax=Leptosphaeria maculans TaxID=5022 RepID=UPI003321D46D|nr:hypothetical protein IAQ61_002823 [Plenodomus lingam]